MPASSYVNTYLQLWCWVNDAFIMVRVRNYLIAGKSEQAKRASKAYLELLKGLPKLAGVAANKGLPTVFEVQGDQYVTTSLERVSLGKAAPNEIQDYIWLASLCGLVDEGTVTAYADSNLGVDCGGFVANYWGMGRPSVTTPVVEGATGFKPRYIWKKFAGMRRKSVSEIQVDDAAVFFQDVKYDDPNIEAVQGAGGAWDTSSGSQAFHIGVVNSISVVSVTPGKPGTQGKPGTPETGQVVLEIAESSGATASSGGDGVNVRSLGQIKATVAKGLVYCPDGNNRIYFVGRNAGPTPYMPNLYDAS